MKKILLSVLLLVATLALSLLVSCEDTPKQNEDGAGNSDASQDSGSTDDGDGEKSEQDSGAQDNGSPENGEPENGDGAEGDENEEKSEDDVTTYPPSDPSDPYENDKHWELP